LPINQANPITVNFLNITYSVTTLLALSATVGGTSQELQGAEAVMGTLHESRLAEDSFHENPRNMQYSNRTEIDSTQI